MPPSNPEPTPSRPRKPRNRRNPRNPLALVGVGIILVSSLALVFAFSHSGDTAARPGLVVYCAHDSVYSESILRGFEKRTGIPVSIRFDSEATKSLGLEEMLLREKDRPRCDVFWNNGPLGT